MPATDEMDHLLTVPLHAFVAERRRVADTLKAAGRRADAAEIAKLVKPSLPVWVINQLARREGALVKRLGTLTTELRGAPMDRQGLQRDTGQAGASEYAQILGAHREALRLLRAAAEKILQSAGQGGNAHTLERVVHTLRAGVADDETRAAIEIGRLLHEVGEQDFTSLMGSLDHMRAGAPARAATRPKDRDAAHPKKQDDRGDREVRPRDREPAHAPAAQGKEANRERARIREQAALVRERERARAVAQRALDRLRPQIAAAEKAVAQEERALEAARKALAVAEQRAGAARGRLEALIQDREAAQAAARASAPR